MQSMVEASGLPHPFLPKFKEAQAGAKHERNIVQ